jgi:hypothetical protein
MRNLLFKLFVKLAGLFSVKEDWAEEQLDREAQLKICAERQTEMDKCTRPRSHPKLKGLSRYTDYYEDES